jgi:hypothetical protein
MVKQKEFLESLQAALSRLSDDYEMYLALGKAEAVYRVLARIEVFKAQIRQLSPKKHEFHANWKKNKLSWRSFGQASTIAGGANTLHQFSFQLPAS